MPKEKDLRDRTKKFDLQIVRMFSDLPKTTLGPSLGLYLKEGQKGSAWACIDSSDSEEGTSSFRLVV